MDEFCCWLVQLKSIFISNYWQYSRRILIDTGERDKPEYVALLSRVLRDEKVEGFDHILITHWHHDHIGGLDAVSAAVGPGKFIN